jgi:hypothetical protein
MRFPSYHWKVFQLHGCSRRCVTVYLAEEETVPTAPAASQDPEEWQDGREGMAGKEKQGTRSYLCNRHGELTRCEQRATTSLRNIERTTTT